jgi:hypothetical protein
MKFSNKCLRSFCAVYKEIQEINSDCLKLFFIELAIYTAIYVMAKC